jgi:phosphatidylinositol glycan class Q protein
MDLLDTVLYLLLDWTIGLWLLGQFKAFQIDLNVGILLTNYQEMFILPLRENIQWLMGAPAGFKLNFHLAFALGNGILLWIDLWGFFLHQLVVVLSLSSSFSTNQICFSMSFLVAYWLDVLYLFTWNFYGVYHYFQKLQKWHLSFLNSFWKLFLGQKKNILRQRVDSCEYDISQVSVYLSNYLSSYLSIYSSCSYGCIVLLLVYCIVIIGNFFFYNLFFFDHDNNVFFCVFYNCLWSNLVC